MRFLDMSRWVMLAVLEHRLRSILTVIGFAVGIASVSLLSALGEGMRQFIMHEFTQFGSNIVVVTPGKTETFGLGGMLNTTRPLSLDDAVQIQQLGFVEYVVPLVFGSGQIKSATHSRYTDIAAVGPQAARAWKISVAQGRFLPEDDLQQPRAYAALGSKLKMELFGDKNALGKTVSIAQNRFRVIGVMEPKGEFLGTDLDDLIYIPTQKGLQIFNRESLMEIDIFYRENNSAKQIEQKIRNFLTAKHGREDFTIVTQDAMLKSLDNILKIVKIAIASFGAISLLVGAVGILTIFNITLNERKQEIGLLRALGFTREQLRNLFLAEAVVLALSGGVLGYAFVMAPMLLAKLALPQFPIAFDFSILVLALLVSALVGVFSGLKPAMQASRLPPIDALRDE
ncbi:MAG: ABC transporter permease [Agarilytica sp.]